MTVDKGVEIPRSGDLTWTNRRATLGEEPVFGDTPEAATFKREFLYIVPILATLER